MIWNVPNTLTAARIVLAIVVFVLIGCGQYMAALVVFAVAAATDWVDGYWARKYDQVTQFGRIFDPFADKLIVCGTFIFLSSIANSGIPAWVSVVLVARELLVTALRSLMESRGVDFSATWAGKLKMGFQVAAIVASLIALTQAPSDATTTWYCTVDGLPLWLYWALPICVWVAALSTIQSGWEYLLKALPALTAE